MRVVGAGQGADPEGCERPRQRETGEAGERRRGGAGERMSRGHGSGGIEEQGGLVDICRRYDLVAVYAFGSRAEEIGRWVRGEDVADAYDLYVLRRAGDLAPLERERMALILGEE